MPQPSYTQKPSAGTAHAYSRRSLVLICLAIFLLALALRIAAIAFVGLNSSRPGQWSESGVIAQNLIAGQGYTFNFFGLRKEQPLHSFMPPLFVGLLYACLRFGAQPALTLALAHAGLSSLTAVAIFLLAVLLSRRRSVALLSGLAAAAYPVMVLMITIPISLTLHLAVLAWALVLTTWLAQKPSWLLALAAGASWGVLTLGRPAIVAFLPLVFLWLWWNRRTRQDWLKSISLILIGVILILLPWTVRNFRIHDRLILISTNSGATFWNGNSPFSTGTGFGVYTEKLDDYLGRPHDPNQPPIIQTLQPYPMPLDLQAEVATVSEMELDRRQLQASLTLIRQNPQPWLALMKQKAIGFLWFRRDIGALYDPTWTTYYKPAYVILLILTVLGLAVSARQWRRYSLLYLLFIFYTVIHILYNVQTRYRWEIEPFFLIFAALFAVEVFDRVSAGRKRHDVMAVSPPLVGS